MSEKTINTELKPDTLEEQAVMISRGGERRKVLAVDDSEVMLKKLEVQFKASAELQDLDLITASSPVKAYKVLITSKVSLVLLDWHLAHEMTGLDLLKKIKANAVLRDLPVIMVTVEGDKKNIVEAIQAGAKDYILKPVRNQQLADKILRCLAA